MTKMKTLEVTAGKVLIFKILNEVKLISNKEALKVLLVHVLA